MPKNMALTALETFNSDKTAWEFHNRSGVK